MGIDSKTIEREKRQKKEKKHITDKNKGDGVDLEQVNWNGMKWQMSEHARRTHKLIYKVSVRSEQN